MRLKSFVFFALIGALTLASTAFGAEKKAKKDYISSWKITQVQKAWLKSWKAFLDEEQVLRKLVEAHKLEGEPVSDEARATRNEDLEAQLGVLDLKRADFFVQSDIMVEFFKSFESAKDPKRAYVLEKYSEVRAVFGTFVIRAKENHTQMIGALEKKVELLQSVVEWTEKLQTAPAEKVPAIEQYLAAAQVNVEALDKLAQAAETSMKASYTAQAAGVSLIESVGSAVSASLNVIKADRNLQVAQANYAAVQKLMRDLEDYSAKLDADYAQAQRDYQAQLAMDAAQREQKRQDRAAASQQCCNTQPSAPAPEKKKDGFFKNGILHNVAYGGAMMLDGIGNATGCLFSMSLFDCGTRIYPLSEAVGQPE